MALVAPPPKRGPELEPVSPQINKGVWAHDCCIYCVLCEKQGLLCGLHSVLQFLRFFLFYTKYKMVLLYKYAGGGGVVTGAGYKWRLFFWSAEAPIQSGGVGWLCGNLVT